MTLLVIGVILFLTFQSFRLIPFIFFPPSQDARFTLDINLPEASAIQSTERLANKIEDYIDKNWLAKDDQAGITNYSVYIGNNGPRYTLSHGGGASTSNTAFFLFNTSDAAIIDTLVPKLAKHIFDNYPDASASVSKLAVGAAATTPIEIRVTGPKIDGLYELSSLIREQLERVDGTQNVTDDWGPKVKKFVVNIDEAAAQRAGISNADVAASLRNQFGGSPVTEYREGSELIPVVLRAQTEAHNENIGTPATLAVFDQSGERAHDLGEFAEPELEWQAGKILRYDRERTITVTTDILQHANAANIVAQLQPTLAGLFANEKWQNYRFELGGDAEKSSDANASINTKLPIAAAIILFLLMIQFNSLRKTTIVLATIPLSLTGVAAGLLLTGTSFGFMTFLGVISLAGIVINNSIVLIDRIDTERNVNQRDIYEAIMLACRQRVRPIILTTLTTLLGMLPLWLGGGPLWESMAITIIFGLLYATMITLLVVPLLYTLLYGASEEGFRRLDLSALEI